jgi:hypothetical protein
MTEALHSFGIEIDLFLLRKRWFLRSLSKTMPRCLSCSIEEHENMKISSMYTWTKRPMQLQHIAVISRWNVDGALQCPICITWLLKVPSIVANAVLDT